MLCHNISTASGNKQIFVWSNTTDIYFNVPNCEYYKFKSNCGGMFYFNYFNTTYDNQRVIISIFSKFEFTIGSTRNLQAPCIYYLPKLTLKFPLYTLIDISINITRFGNLQAIESLNVPFLEPT